METSENFENWRAHGWGIRVETPHQLFRIINHIALLENSRTYAWRGQNDDSWNLSSSLYRYLSEKKTSVNEQAMREEENKILKEARKWGLGRDLGPSATDLHLLASLQHHGVPTRLIDVTSNPMTALWFATEEIISITEGKEVRKPGVLFAFDVTQTPWYESFEHSSSNTWDHLSSPLSATYNRALEVSKEEQMMFRIFSALPDARMQAQEGFFLGSTLPNIHKVPGLIGFNPNGSAPGKEKLAKLLATERGKGRPDSITFCAIVIPPNVKDKIRGPLKRTYNRRRRVLFPDIDGFRDGFWRNQLD